MSPTNNDKLDAQPLITETRKVSSSDKISTQPLHTAHGSPGANPRFSVDERASDEYNSISGRSVKSVASAGTCLSHRHPVLFPPAGETEEGSVTTVQMVANLVTGGLGTGILSMPWCTAGASLFTSVAIAGCVLCLNAATIMVLVYAAERHQRFDLGALMGTIPGRLGPIAQWVCDVCVWISMWLCLLGYMIVVGDSFTEVTPDHGIAGKRAFWVAVGTVMCLPICFVEQKYLSFTSTLSICVNIFLFVYLCVHAGVLKHEGNLPGGFCALGFTKGNIAFLSNMMFTTVVQLCILPMYRELKDRSPRKFLGVLSASFGSLWVLFSLFAAVGYLAYGADVESNVLKMFPDNALGHSARIGMLFVILGVYPIMLMPMVAPVRTWEEPFAREAKAKGVPFFAQRIRSTAATIFIALTVMAAGFFLTDLGFVNVINGALCAAVFVGLCPGLVMWHLSDRTDFMWRALTVLLMFVCFVLAGFGFVFTDNYADKLEDHCKWKWD
eukprot:Hpha_TRINITY_DN13880_c0_g1::TRINITY_DN13880_c0_g1_i1::g.69774::m.69774